MYVLVHLFFHKIVSSHTIFYFDNEPVATVDNKHPYLNSTSYILLDLFCFTETKLQLTLTGQHILFLENIMADRISRFQVTSQLPKQFGMPEEKTMVLSNPQKVNFDFTSPGC